MSDAFNCAHARCGRPLGVGHVVLITTTNVRRLYHVACVADGYHAWCGAIMAGQARAHDHGFSKAAAVKPGIHAGSLLSSSWYPVLRDVNATAN